MLRSQIATPLEEPFARRYHDEGEGSRGSRSPYQQDRDRILYSRAFRRLMHKTQVFVAPQGDHFRTRLTHTLEVAQIARSIARALGVDEDLTETIALAHDLGHPPFGHAGEEELNDLMKKKGGDPNGFDHNVQTLRLVTKLEFLGHNFSGLNLTATTLEGLLKHHGVKERETKKNRNKKTDEENFKWFFSTMEKLNNDFRFFTPASLEAQCACIADEIAYNHHDLEDGLRAQHIEIDEVCACVPHVKKKYNSIKKSSLKEQRIIHRLISDLIGESVEDIIANTNKQLSNISSYEALREIDKDLVLLSEEQENNNACLGKFLKERLYGHKNIEREGEKGRYIIRWLFHALPGNPHCWDKVFLERYQQDKQQDKDSRALADDIAGMTDNYAYRVRDAIGGSLSMGIEETSGKNPPLE